MGLFSSVLGFLSARKNNKTQAAMHARDSYNNSPQGIRANAEEAGFNPLTVLTSGRQFGAGYTPTFENEGIHLGNAVQAGLTALDRQKLQVTQLKKQNHRLQTLVNNTTFDVKAPSVYERRSGNVGRTDPVSGTGSSTAGSFGSTPEEVRLDGYKVLRAQGSAASSVLTNPGLVDVISEHYGDEVGDYEGFLNYTKDWWYGRVKQDDYFPGFGWESQITRPRARPSSIEQSNRNTETQRSQVRSRPSGRIMTPSLSGGNANDFYQSLFN